MGHISCYTWAMKPRNEGMGHGKEKGVSTGDVHERVRNREEMRGVSGKSAVAR